MAARDALAATASGTVALAKRDGQPPALLEPLLPLLTVVPDTAPAPLALPAALTASSSSGDGTMKAPVAAPHPVRCMGRKPRPMTEAPFVYERGTKACRGKELLGMPWPEEPACTLPAMFTAVCRLLVARPPVARAAVLRAGLLPVPPPILLPLPVPALRLDEALRADTLPVLLAGPADAERTGSAAHMDGAVARPPPCCRGSGTWEPKRRNTRA